LSFGILARNLSKHYTKTLKWAASVQQWRALCAWGPGWWLLTPLPPGHACAPACGWATSRHGPFRMPTLPLSRRGWIHPRQPHRHRDFV